MWFGTGDMAMLLDMGYDSEEVYGYVTWDMEWAMCL